MEVEEGERGRRINRGEGRSEEAGFVMWGKRALLGVQSSFPRLASLPLGDINRHPYTRRGVHNERGTLTTERGSLCAVFALFAAIQGRKETTMRSYLSTCMCNVALTLVHSRH